MHNISSLLNHERRLRSSTNRLLRIIFFGAIALILYYSSKTPMVWGATNVLTPAVPEKLVPRLVVQTGHDTMINSVTFSPDGRTLASGASLDNSVKLWNVATGRELRTLTDHRHDLSYDVNSVVFSPDGRTLVSGGTNDFITFWDVATGRELRKLSRKGGFGSVVVLSADGHKLASNEYNAIKLWDFVSGKELRTLNGPGTVNSLAFSPDGRTLVAGVWDKATPTLHAIKLWDVATGRELRTLKGLESTVRAIAFSPDGRKLASGSDVIKLWDVATGSELITLNGQNGMIDSLVFSPDGHMIASSASDKTVKLWDVATGRELQALIGHAHWVKSMAFSPDGKMLASASADHSVKLWDLKSGLELVVLGEMASSVNSIVLSPDGGMLVTGGSDSLIRQWDLSSGKQLDIPGKQLETLQKDPFGIGGVAYSSDGKTIASVGHNAIRLWGADTGADVLTLYRDESIKPNLGSVGFNDTPHFVFCPGKKTSSLCDGFMSIGTSVFEWAALNGNIQKTLVASEVATNSLVLSPDGVMLAFGGKNDVGRVTIWDITLKQQLRSINTGGFVSSLAFSPDSKMMVSGHSTIIRVWDVSTGVLVRTLDAPGDWVNTVAFSPDGRRLVSSGYSADSTVKLWDVRTGLLLQKLHGHEGQVNSVIYTSDGRFIISGATDKTTRIWRASDGTHLATLYSFNNGTWAVTDPEGRFDTADLEEIKGLHWVMPDDPLTPVPLEAFMRDYYEPRLLPRILNGEKFKPVRALMDLNRVQPKVKIVKVFPDHKSAERVSIEVEVSGSRKSYERNGKKVSVDTAAHDLRLFRDGQLVGYLDGNVVKQGGKPYRKTFSVRLPTIMSGKEITFSTYAFNDDRVKSATARQSYQVPATVVTRKGNAYLVHMGVNNFTNPVWNLNFAASDARLMRQTLSNRLQKSGNYQNIISLSLISDEHEHRADKALLHAVFDRLAGKPASSMLRDLPGADQLRPATPDDLVLFSFAGHGYADGGDFYLITQDTGKGKDREVDGEMLRSGVSSDELSQWLKNVDAGDMTLIVDACQSAASVEGKDFKPGPMDSRGLGQLSFDKGMRILAASQADEYALENDKIQQGLLTFALVTNGIEAFEADYAPRDNKIMLDEWLRYGVRRVPDLVEEIKTGNVIVAKRSNTRALIRINKAVYNTNIPRPAQQPVLFDFAKKRRQVEVAVE